MPAYVTSNLLKDEKIIYRGHRHWIVFWQPIFWLFVAFAANFFPTTKPFSTFVLIFGVILGIGAIINYFMSEIVVTNMRVLIKVGFIARTSLETMLQNVASIEIVQSMLGRILNYGTVIICDTGRTRTPFNYICAPFLLRRTTQEQIDARYPSPAPTANT